MWQGALRDRGEAAYDAIAAAIDGREAITVELLYSDQVGEQGTITRFGLTPYGEEDDWIASVNRHWFLDRPGPRSEPDQQAAQERILQTLEIAQEDAQAAEPNGAEPAQREPLQPEQPRD
jgi:hypothetical protein